MADEKPKPGTMIYTLEDVTRGLMAVIEWRGSYRRAARETGFPESALRKWAVEQYPEKLSQLEREYAEEIERELVMEARENAKIAGRATREGILKVQDQIVNGVEVECPRCDGRGVVEQDDGEDVEPCERCARTGRVRAPLVGRDLATATYQLSKIMATNVDKVLALTGRPTNGREASGDILNLVRELAGAGAVRVRNEADGTAEELPAGEAPVLSRSDERE